MEAVVRSMIDGLRESARAEKGPDAPAGGQVVQDLLVSCAGIMKSLSNTLDLMRSLPVEVDSRNKLRGNVGLGKGTPPLSIPPKAPEWW